MPAHYIAFFLVDDRLTAMKAGYRGSYHESMLSMVRRMLGPPSEGGEDSAALSWRAGDGLALLPRDAVNDKDESAPLWLGPALAVQAGRWAVLNNSRIVIPARACPRMG